jgi:DNA-binding response OmpR family regulator
VIVELLRTRGYRVVVAADGLAARAHIAEVIPELAILDLALPEVSDFELLAEWRAIRALLTSLFLSRPAKN